MNEDYETEREKISRNEILYNKSPKEFKKWGFRIYTLDTNPYSGKLMEVDEED